MSTKIKAQRVTEGMTIKIGKFYFNPNDDPKMYALSPEKKAVSQIVTIKKAEVVQSFNTGNGRRFIMQLIKFTTADMIEFYGYSTNNFELV